MKNNLPKVKFNNMSIDDVVDLLAWTVFETDGPFPLSKYVYDMYPELKGLINWGPDKIDDLDSKKIIKSAILKRYDEYLSSNINLPDGYQKIWDEYNDKFMIALSSRLDIKWPQDCNNIVAGIGLIPIYPRDIQSRTFNIGTMDRKWVIETAMHECSHFLFFEKWKQLYPDWKWEDFESPNIIWYLSEMLVDPILNCPEMQNVFDNKFWAYDSFYNLKINDESVMGYINDIFKNNNIKDAITKSYDYVLENEQLIRKQCDG